MSSKFTIYDIARIANVSIATVSRVINGGKGVSEKTKKHVENIIKKYNYAPSAIARGLVKNTTNTVGIVVDDIRKPFYASTIYGMEQKLDSMGFIAMLCNTGGDITSNTNRLKLLAEKKIDGLVLIASNLNKDTIDLNVLELFKDIPIIAINTLHDLKMDNLYHVIRDEAAAIDLAVGHFVEKGQHKILYVEAKDSASYHVKLAQTAFNNAIQKYNLRPEACRFLTLERNVLSGQKAIEELSSNKLPFNAVMCRSASTAIGIVNKIISLGYQVPDDVSSIVMTDSSYLSIYNPGISAVLFDHEQIGFTASMLLCSAINGEPTPHYISIMPQLIHR